MIAVVDYEAGNLTSVETALRYLDASFRVTSDPDVLLKSDKVIFPGVGEARHAMGILAERGLDEALKDFASSGKPPVRHMPGLSDPSGSFRRAGCRAIGNHTG
jgi:glutamine amidotransferase